MPTLLWAFYTDLKTYKQAPDAALADQLRAHFDDIFTRRTGWVTLHRLLSRLATDRAELAMVLDYPEILLHTNGSERDIRCQVIKRHISGATKSTEGRRPRHFPGLDAADRTLAVSHWAFFGHRLGVAGARTVPPLPTLNRARASPT